MRGARRPGQARAPRPRDDGEERRVFTVTELVSLSREILEQALPGVLVRGEISNFHAHTSGHWYFKLKDRNAVLDVVMFRGDNERVPFDVEEGMEVVLGGRPTIYPGRGRYQLVADLMEPVGWGALQLAFEQLKQRLDHEGLFDSDRKRPLPLLPRSVGVVTSATGAAWRDMCRVWQRNEVPLHVVLSPARVQGEGAAAEVAAAIRRLDRHGVVEVMIVGRGGGSREDLWAFNEEAVARAIAGAGVPVVSAVGHEVDQTIADLVADHRAATPTAAAEIVAASRERLESRMWTALRRTHGDLAARLSRARARLNEPRLQRRLRQPAGLMAVYRQRLDDAFGRVDAATSEALGGRRARLRRAGALLSRAAPAGRFLAARHRLERATARARVALRDRLGEARGELSSTAARIHALSPLSVLGRGYSICADDAGRILRSAGDVAAGDAVRVRLARGELDCTVEATHDEPPDADAGHQQLPGSC